MSGHSKWSQIKHKKAASDAKRGQLFSKMVREIMVAARSGNPDPEINSALYSAIERARANGLPKDNIERAIEKASGEGGATALTEFLYEATAPQGVVILIEGISDNTNRTVSEIKKILAGHNAKLAEPGSVSWNFEKVGTIRVNPERNPAIPKDQLELKIIDAGAREIREVEGNLIIETNFNKLEQVRLGIKERGVIIEETGYDFSPKTSLKLSVPEKSEVEKLLDALADQDDVQEVYSNLSG